METLEVVAGIVVRNSQVLCVKRNQNNTDYNSGKWEFPGGKLEKEESLISGLKRELDEELSINIRDPKFFMTVSHRYPDYEIIMHVFICSIQSSQIILRDHSDYLWLTKENLIELNWSEADVPVVQALINS